MIITMSMSVICRSAPTYDVHFYYFHHDRDAGDQEYEQASQVGESVMIDGNEKGEHWTVCERIGF